jgi:hypothetical protein
MTTEMMLLKDTPPDVMHERIMRFEALLKTLPQVDIPVEHFFASGVYVRQIRIPKDTFLTGAVYREPHIHFVLQGEMDVATENGVVRVTAPHTFVSPPGIKRAGYAHEDTVWAAAFRTDDTDPEAIMAALTVNLFEGEQQ